MKIEVYINRNLGQADDSNNQPSSANGSLQVPIQLLNKLKGVKGDDMCCNLLHTSLLNHIQYETLSYV